ncbi:MAG TPA: hypothetical protein VL691_04425 [Vicinamibacteria bacterium]|nr:hypothetical protein [Vicinamibacteria bacterium]
MDASALLIALLLLAPWLPAQDVAFREFFEPTPRELRPSARLLSLEGRRVRLVGFMVRSEEPPTGGFFLCPFPAVATESGGGTADLPPETVFVVVPAARGRLIPHSTRQVVVEGVLELGSRAGEDGQVSAIRVVLDRPLPNAAGPGQPALSQP